MLLGPYINGSDLDFLYIYPSIPSDFPPPTILCKYPTRIRITLFSFYKRKAPKGWAREWQLAEKMKKVTQKGAFSLRVLVLCQRPDYGTEHELHVSVYRVDPYQSAYAWCNKDSQVSTPSLGTYDNLNPLWETVIVAQNQVSTSTKTRCTRPFRVDTIPEKYHLLVSPMMQLHYRYSMYCPRLLFLCMYALNLIRGGARK